MTKMSKILDCNVERCAYNKDMKCNAQAVNVGGSGPVCHAFVEASARCVKPGIAGGVGACKVKECRFNDCFLCAAEGIRVNWSGREAICDTFQAR